VGPPYPGPVKAAGEQALDRRRRDPRHSPSQAPSQERHLDRSDPAELVTILCEHIAEFGVSADCRLFRNRTDSPLQTNYATAGAAARPLALTPDKVASQLADRPYSLRRTAVPLWLNIGVPSPTWQRERVMESIVLSHVYAKCANGTEGTANVSIHRLVDIY
jgi:hypothetical protein